MVKFRGLLLLLSFASLAQAQTSAGPDLSCKPSATLSQKDVAELILKQGRKTQEINSQYQQLRLALAQVLSNYQWDFHGQVGYLYDKSETFQVASFYKQETWTSDFVLQKNFTSGTTVSAEYQQTSFKGDPNANFSPLFYYSTLATQDMLGVNITQNIWSDFMGAADRAAVESADLSYRSSMLLRANDLENLVLSTIQQYWTTYVSEQTFKEAIDARERSRKLTEGVKKKSAFGYANPGELAQAQADYEANVQAVKTTSTVYLANLDTLNTLLSLPQGCEIKFQINDVIPAVPQLPEKSVENLRSIRSEKLKMQSAQRDYDSAAAKDAPTLQFVGKIYTFGVEQDAGNAYSDMIAGSHPQYYAGVKFDYPFGNDILGEARLNRKYAKELEETKLSRLTQEAKDTLAQAQRKVQSSYAAVLSSIEQRKYRERAMQELTRSYNQGRTDISIYITAMNQYSASQVQYSQSIGDYQTALNAWAAARDELIPDTQEEK